MCGLLDRMTDKRGEREGAKWSGNGPHEEFLELCAVSTSGDLTEEEQKRLQVHLAGCPECRQALKEFETAVDLGVPLLASKLESISSEKSATVQRELSHPVSRHGMHSETPVGRKAGCCNERNRKKRFCLRWKKGVTGPRR